MRAFLRFLLDRGVIDRAALPEIESKKADTNVSLGVIAINRGLLSAEQAEVIHDAQKGTGQKFGQTALRLRLLNRAQVRGLLAEQKKANLDAGDLLVLTGYLSSKQLEKERRAFARRKG